jgi:hypothetical protein
MASAQEDCRPLQKRSWYRTTLFNAFVIGGVGFLAPGLWNAMSNLGAGGAQSPFLVNAANALVFGLSMSRTQSSLGLLGVFWLISYLVGFLCLLGGPISNRIGLSYTLLLGAVGYPIYS